MISKQLKFCLFQNFSKNSRPFRAKKRFIGTTNITYQLSKIEFPFFHQKSASQIKIANSRELLCKPFLLFVFLNICQNQWKINVEKQTICKLI